MAKLPTADRPVLPSRETADGTRPSAGLSKELDDAILCIVRALARQAAREDHERELQEARNRSRDRTIGEGAVLARGRKKGAHKNTDGH
jgi:hypothetical protein